MKKKLIGLSILLLVLLLGLSTTSYAFEYTVTNSDIDLIADTKLNATYATWQKPKIKNALNALYNTYNCDTIFISVRSNQDFYIFGLKNSQITSVGNSTNVNYFNITFTGNIYRYYGSKNNSFSGPTTFSDRNIVIGPGSALTGSYLMYSNDLTSSVSGPWQSENILTFSPPNYFTFIQNLNLDYSGDIALVSSLNDYLGVVSLGKNLDRVQTDYQYYDRYAKQWKIYHSEDLNFSSITDDDFYYYIRYAFNHREQYFLPNTLVQVYFVPKDTEEEFPTYFQPFYIVDRNTRYNTGGGIDLDDTFDDDSYWNYYIGNIDNLIDKQNTDKTTDDIINNDNENTDKIIDTLTDDSEVDNMLAEFGSGDINTMASKFGLPSIPNPFSQFIETIFYGITDVLTLDGDVTLDFGFQGQHMYLHSSDFTTPLNAATVFISGFLTFIYVYYMIELGYRTLINIREFNLDKTGIGNHYGQAGDGLQADGSWRLL